jgi:bacterioferritin-associated ferredoxin
MVPHKRATVTRCVCHRIAFSDLKAEAERRKLTSCRELVQAGLCGGGCSMCIPYVEKMMKTGLTEFVPGDFH